MLKKLKNLCIMASLFSYAASLLAAPSLGEVAENLLTPFSGANSLFIIGCYVLGIGLLAGSFIRFLEYRRNPVQVRWSVPFALFVFGLILVALPTISGMSVASDALQTPGLSELSNSRPVNPTRQEEWRRSSPAQTQQQQAQQVPSKVMPSNATATGNNNGQGVKVYPMTVQPLQKNNENASD